MRITPKDSIDALRLMRKHQDALLTPEDDDEVKESVAGTVAMFLARKRAGEIGEDVDFLDWYENGTAASDGEDDDAPDPTE